MYLALSPDQFNKDNIMLSDKTKNNIIDNGEFYRLYYSDEICNSNGLFIYFSLKNSTIEKYFNKVKCSFPIRENFNIIEKLKSIEKQILEKINFTHKTYRIEEQLNSQFMKIFTEKHIELGKKEQLNLILKVSGIWNNYVSSGITFRFYIF